jgi:hypothetical protein
MTKRHPDNEKMSLLDGRLQEYIFTPESKILAGTIK